MAYEPKPRRILRKTKAMEILPLGNTQWNEHERTDPDFPQKVKLSTTGRAIGYFEDELHAYVEKLAARRDAKLKREKADA
jgi:predicted DNA-binding transcriptional regulator AlpA